MALFDRSEPHGSEEFISSSDAATRALSVTAVENDFVNGVYEKLASVYDLIFGPTLHPGRVDALAVGPALPHPCRLPGRFHIL